VTTVSDLNKNYQPLTSLKARGSSGEQPLPNERKTPPAPARNQNHQSPTVLTEVEPQPSFESFSTGSEPPLPLRETLAGLQVPSAPPRRSTTDEWYEKSILARAQDSDSGSESEDEPQPVQENLSSKENKEQEKEQEKSIEKDILKKNNQEQESLQEEERERREQQLKKPQTSPKERESAAKKSSEEDGSPKTRPDELPKSQSDETRSQPDELPTVTRDPEANDLRPLMEDTKKTDNESENEIDKETIKIEQAEKNVLNDPLTSTMKNLVIDEIFSFDEATPKPEKGRPKSVLEMPSSKDAPPLPPRPHGSSNTNQQTKPTTSKPRTTSHMFEDLGDFSFSGPAEKTPSVAPSFLGLNTPAGITTTSTSSRSTSFQSSSDAEQLFSFSTPTSFPPSSSSAPKPPTKKGLFNMDMEELLTKVHLPWHL